MKAYEIKIIKKLLIHNYNDKNIEKIRMKSFFLTTIFKQKVLEQEIKYETKWKLNYLIIFVILHILFNIHSRWKCSKLHFFQYLFHFILKFSHLENFLIEWNF